MNPNQSQTEKLNLDYLIKILLKEELGNCQKQKIKPTIDYMALQIISKNNIINSGILGLNFQKREAYLKSTIQNSILRVCENDEEVGLEMVPQILINQYSSNSYSLFLKYDKFSIFSNEIIKLCHKNNISLIEYDKLTSIEINYIKKLNIETIFICTNFTPYGIKERKVISDRFKESNINSISIFLNKSQCNDLFSIKLSLKQKLRYKEFVKEHGDDTFYLDQLSPDFINSELNKLKNIC